MDSATSVARKLPRSHISISLGNSSYNEQITRVRIAGSQLQVRPTDADDQVQFWAPVDFALAYPTMSATAQSKVVGMTDGETLVVHSASAHCHAPSRNFV